MTQRSRVSQAELTRIFKAAKSAGVAVRLLIQPDGAIEVTTIDAAAAHGVGRNPLDRLFDDEAQNPWDEVFEDTTKEGQ